MQKSQRMKELSSAIFSEMNVRKQQVEARNIKVINLGIGSPDRSPAPHIIEAMHRALDKAGNYTYPITGKPELHQALADWYLKRFGVYLDPRNEVLVLMGSQDGLGHIALAYIDPGDIALVPDPGYPIYSASILLAQGKVYPMPLLAENKFLPDLSAIPADVAQRAKLMWLNYPNNPVAAVADRSFFEQVVDFAKKNNILVCHDVAYSELAYDGYKPISFLEVPGAKEVGIEFYSVSKTYSMAGCRCGFAVGNAEVLSSLATIKSNIDYGVFSVVQEGAVAALTGSQDCVVENARIYQQRRDVLVDGLASLGWKMPKPRASMFVWAPIPKGYTSSYQFAIELLEKTGVLVIPGVAFGEQGEGYVRIALVQPEEQLKEALERIKNNFVFN
ncbi:LL-diaminopimelate aminotransferase [Desulfohalotomaculum tongense]|uniref:LL-diaminopimelate aminotransferase n=1 Tax=Desulforadius tongensis TaxID=1216062 RepID=UPI00195843B0|nr:LL-diaminopimelate aminotransferase [Desulforadius tongensis]MBM7854483.1 LL-diaminopimelate aminotransferase [Desulforadius tongensis]